LKLCLFDENCQIYSFAHTVIFTLTFRFQSKMILHCKYLSLSSLMLDQMTLSFVVFRALKFLLLKALAFLTLKDQHLGLQLFIFLIRVHFKFENELVITSKCFLLCQSKQTLLFKFANQIKVTITLIYAQISNHVEQHRNHQWIES